MSEQDFRPRAFAMAPAARPLIVSRGGRVIDTSVADIVKRRRARHSSRASSSPSSTSSSGGGRAALSAVVLADLGDRKVRLYEASRLGYSSWLSAPVADEVWADLGALPAAIKGLDKRIRDLERQSDKPARQPSRP